MQTTTDKIPPSPLVLANSVDEALTVLKSAGPNSVLLAGGTWLMRAKARQEATDQVFVSLSRIEELQTIEINEDAINLGSMVTHDSLSKALVGMQDPAGLFQAANKSANPAVRRMATIGGNICTTVFPAADLLPMLLSLNASVKLKSLSGSRNIPLADFVATGRQSTHDELLTNIHIPRCGHFSSHSRMLMRKAGEYPVANLSLCAGFDPTGIVNYARIVVGSVETRPKQWIGLERAILGARIAATDVKALAKSYVDEFDARDDTDAPGWYRKRMLPVLAARAFKEVASEYDRSTR